MIYRNRITISRDLKAIASTVYFLEAIAITVSRDFKAITLTIKDICRLSLFINHYLFLHKFFNNFFDHIILYI